MRFHSRLILLSCPTRPSAAKHFSIAIQAISFFCIVSAETFGLMMTGFSRISRSRYSFDSFVHRMRPVSSAILGRRASGRGAYLGDLRIHNGILVRRLRERKLQ